MVSTLLKDYSRNIRLARDRARALERAVPIIEVHLGPSTCHAISGRGDESGRALAVLSTTLPPNSSI
jgi:hypothetical protein